MTAVAISNNDMVYLHWNVSGKIPDCLGFNIIRHDAMSKHQESLPAMVGFPSPDKSEKKKAAGQTFRNTSVWPVQKYAWKDLFAKRGGTYWYEIVPMLGTPGNLKPDLANAMRTNSVTLDSKQGDCAVFFNRGIISTQAIARSLTKGKSGIPNTKTLEEAIKKPGNPLRIRLAGELENGVLTLLERAKKEGGQCYCALYELSDKDLVDNLAALKDKVHIVLSNAGEDTKKGAGDGDKTNTGARKSFHKLKLDVTDRMFKKGHIGHNKFVVYVGKNGPEAVLSGSTNWTPTGLCAQSNNAIIIESADLANQYLAYWKLLQKDTKDAGKDRTALQAKTFRESNKKERPRERLKDNNKKSSGNLRVWFSPNTPQKTVPRKKGVSPPTPADLTEVFDLIQKAKQGALFLAFIPGNPSIVTSLKEVYDARIKQKELFYLRGAATSPDPAEVFKVDLYHRSSKSDATVRAVDKPPTLRADAKVASVAGIFAAFGAWEAEIYKIGHAVIHDKIVVIDPFTDDSVVITGSHNLGFRASYANDENFLVIRGNRAVAGAYAAHVLDVYEHYRWRWKLQEPLRAAFAKLKQKNPNAKAGDLWKKAVAMTRPSIVQTAWHNLVPKDTWQDFYVKNKDFLAAETNFWSSFGGVGLARGIIHDPARGRG
jgi:phosphatidylserine/phosphatidylglycerophosphate/cardiolipin synthase-like enzyme